MAVLLERPHPCNRPYFSETVNDADGLLCLDEQTRVLDSTLRWRPIGDLDIGDRLVAFDEANGPALRPGLGAPSRYRHMAMATVTATQRVVKPCYRLTFSDGTTVIASDDHQWLAGSHRADSGGWAWRWITTKGLVANRRLQRSWVLKVCEVVEQEQTYEAGWLGGFLDGEGNLKTVSDLQSGWSINASQKVGPEGDRYVKMLMERGFDVRMHTPRQRSPKHQLQTAYVVGNKRQVLRLLMMVRPERLISTWANNLPYCSLYGREHAAVSLQAKEFLGEREVVALTTDTHTYIAEGLASHNCNAWRSMQWHPEATAEACSWPVSEVCKQARQAALLEWAGHGMLDLLAGSPYWCDPEMGGWWLYGVCCQIGAFHGDGPWTADPVTGRLVKRGERGISRKRPHLSNDGQGVIHAGLREPGVSRTRPHLSDNGQGVTRPQLREPGVYRNLPHLSNDGQGVIHAGLREPGVYRDRPHLTNNGQGVIRPQLREPGVRRNLPAIGNNGMGVNRPQLREPGIGNDPEFHPLVMPELLRWFHWLSARLRHVRIVNGDWTRVVTDGARLTLPVRQGNGPCGVFLDPPYSAAERDGVLYRNESDVTAAVRAWCLENGTDPRTRIVLAGYDTEHTALEAAGWTVHEWYTEGFLRGGYGNIDGSSQQKRERLWASPTCITQEVAQMALW